MTALALPRSLNPPLCSPGELIEHALNDAPPELFDDDTIAGLDRVSLPIPRVASVGFECRLAGDALGRVDFGFCIPRDLPVANPIETLPRRTSTWSRLARLGSDWQRETPAMSAVDAIFLEFDRREDAHNWSSEPVVFFRFGDGVNTSRARATAVGVLAAIEPQHRAAFAHQIAPATEVLPTTALVTDCASLCARSTVAARIGVMMSATDVGAYLRRLGWPGPIESVEHLVSQTLHDQQWLRIQLDVGSATPKVGIEAYYDPRPTRVGLWKPLIDRLVAAGLCERPLGDAVLRWPANGRLHRKDRTTATRTLSHVKVSIDSAGAVAAKAYLFASPPSLL